MKFKHKIKNILFLVTTCTIIACSSTKEKNITPTSAVVDYVLESYSVARTDKTGPNIDYYISHQLGNESYPIVILVGGSTDKEHLASIIDFHKYFVKQLAANKLGALSVDGWGINSTQRNESEFIHHYTRSQILSNYQQVINHIENNPPHGWNGKLAVLGVSEGGPIATQLNEQNQRIIATVLWSGAIDKSWQETLWLDMQNIYQSVCVANKHPVPDCYDLVSKEKFESRINNIVANPTPETYFFNMTNMYVADGVQFPKVNYNKLHGHILIVTGAKDTIINSSDDFYATATKHQLNTDYWRIESMDHMIKKHPELIDNSFIWLSKQLNQSKVLN